MASDDNSQISNHVICLLLQCNFEEVEVRKIENDERLIDNVDDLRGLGCSQWSTKSRYVRYHNLALWS